jgi:hypothetical protein
MSRLNEMSSGRRRVRRTRSRSSGRLLARTLIMALMIVGMFRASTKERNMTPKERGRRRRNIVRPTMWAALLAGFFGNALLALYAWAEGSASAFAVGTFASLGAGAIGGGAGFLLALPRFGSSAAAQELDEQIRGRQSVLDDSRTRSMAGVFTPSDNLVQISDWLTNVRSGP